MPGIPSQASQPQEPLSQASPRRRAGPSTNTIPKSYAYGAAPSDARSTVTGGRAPFASSSRQQLAGAPVVNDSRNPLKDTSVQIANAILTASNSISETMPSSSQTTLVGSAQPFRRKPLSNQASSSSFVAPRHLAPPKDSSSDEGGFLRARSPTAITADRARALSPHWVELVQGHQSIHSVIESGGPTDGESTSERDQSISQSADEPSLGSRDYSVMEQDVRHQYQQQRRIEDLHNSYDADAAAAVTQPNQTGSTIKRRRSLKSKNPDNAPFRPGAAEAEQEEADDYYEHHPGESRRRKKIHPAHKVTTLPVMPQTKKRRSTGRRKTQGLGGDEGEPDDDVSETESPSHSPPPITRDLPSTDDITAAQAQEEVEAAVLPADDEELLPEEDTKPASSGSIRIGYIVGQIFNIARWLATTTIDMGSSALSKAGDFISHQISWIQSHVPALLIASLIVSLIAYQLFTPSSYADDSSSGRGILSSIFGRSPNRPRSRPTYTPPTAALPEDMEAYASQLNTMGKDITTLFKDLADLSDSSDSYTNNIRRELERLKLVHDGSEQKHLHSLAEIRRQVNELANKRSGMDDAAVSYLNDRLAKFEVSLERIGDRVKHVESSTAAVESDTRFKDILKRVAQVEAQVHAQAKASTSSGRTPSMGKDGSIPQALADYLEQRLIHWNKDRLGLADYAVFSGGGRIIPTLTSNTFEIPGRKRGWVARVLGFGGSGPNGSAAHQGRPPATAIHPDNNVGHCWPFAGTKGHLGVFLSRQIFIDSVTIDHAPRELVPDITPAPKKVRVWGVIDGQDNLDKLNIYREELGVKKDLGTLTAEEQDELDAVAPGPLPHTLDLLQIASFNYNIDALNNVQTFQIPERIKKLGIDIGVVMFDVQSNHGNDEYTCVYRVRVHGTPRATNVDAEVTEGVAA